MLGVSSDHVRCFVTLRLVPSDDSLARVITVLLRQRWSILELHHRRGDSEDCVRLVAAKSDGRPERLVSALEREVGTISVES